MKNRRFFLKSLLYTSASVSFSGISVSCQKKPAANPNIVLIVVDDLGWKDLGCYGSSFYETKNVDRLAAEGMKFTQAYSSCPVCSPTRAALLTGKSPAKLRFTGHITAIGRHRHPEHSRIIPPDDRMYIPLEEITIAEALKPAGYRSASIGKWHVGNEEKYYPTHQGFDINIAGYKHGSPPAYFYPYKNPELDWNPEIPTLHGGKEGEYLTDRLTDEAISFIESNRNNPFFLYLPYYTVHTPLQAPQDLVGKYEKKLEGNSSQKNAVYGAMVERMDYNVGRVLSLLRASGLEENTVVLFASDNGGLSTVTDNAPLREGKGYLYEGGIRVPLIVKWPGRIELGAECDDPVISHDYFPTICDLVKNSRPGGGIEGTSLVPALLRNKPLPERPLCWYYPHYSPQAQMPGAVIRKGDFKLIQFYDPEKIELYNVAEDIGEQNDLSESMPDRVMELTEELTSWLVSVDAKMHTPNPDYQPGQLE